MEDYAKGGKRRRRLLENRYGRKLFVYTFEKHVSDKWITTNTRPCPHCFSPIQVRFIFNSFSFSLFQAIWFFSSHYVVCLCCRKMADATTCFALIVNGSLRGSDSVDLTLLYSLSQTLDRGCPLPAPQGLHVNDRLFTVTSARSATLQLA